MTACNSSPLRPTKNLRLVANVTCNYGSTGEYDTYTEYDCCMSIMASHGRDKLHV
jgi:hypothetical protein